MIVYVHMITLSTFKAGLGNIAILCYIANQYCKHFHMSVISHVQYIAKILPHITNRIECAIEITLRINAVTHKSVASHNSCYCIQLWWMILCPYIMCKL